MIIYSITCYNESFDIVLLFFFFSWLFSGFPNILMLQLQTYCGERKVLQ